jgi:hypothetical protein
MTRATLLGSVSRTPIKGVTGNLTFGPYSLLFSLFSPPLSSFFKKKKKKKKFNTR